MPGVVAYYIPGYVSAAVNVHPPGPSERRLRLCKREIRRLRPAAVVLAYTRSDGPAACTVHFDAARVSWPCAAVYVRAARGQLPAAPGRPGAATLAPPASGSPCPGGERQPVTLQDRGHDQRGFDHRHRLADATRGPAPNGTNAPAGNCCSCPAAKRSGRNSSGCANQRGRGTWRTRSR